MRKNDPLFQDLPDSFDEPAPAVLPAPENGPPGRRWLDTACGSAWLVVTFVFLVFFVPQLDEVYSQVKVDMPGSTQALTSLSRAVCAWPFVFVPLGLLYPWWLGRPTSSPWGRVSRALGGVAPLFLWIWMIWALFSPLLACGGLRGR